MRQELEIVVARLNNARQASPDPDTFVEFANHIARTSGWGLDAKGLIIEIEIQLGLRNPFRLVHSS